MRALSFLSLLAAASMALWAASAAAHPGCGITCGPDGTVHFVAGPAHQVWRLAPDGATTVILAGGLDQPFRVPHHLILRDERLYTASDAGSRVWEIDPAGEARQIYPPPNTPEAAAVGLGGSPFTVDEQGQIIAAHPDAEGKWSISRIADDGQPRHIAGGFDDLHAGAFAWGPAGGLFLTDAGRRIVRISPDGDVKVLFPAAVEAEATTLPATQPAAGSLRGLAVDGAGTIYACDAEARCVLRIRADGQIQRLGAGGGLTEPSGVALDPQDRLIVLDYEREGDTERVCIRRIEADGSVSTLARIDQPRP